MSYLEPNYCPDVEPDDDLVCPHCKNPFWTMNVYEMETEYDADGYGVYRYDYVSLWQCDNCDHVFMEDDAYSLRGVLEDDDVDLYTPQMLAMFRKRKTELIGLGLW